MATQTVTRDNAVARATMTAAVVHEFGRPLVVTDVPKPAPAEGQVLVRIEASGLCSTYGQLVLG